MFQLPPPRPTPKRMKMHVHHESKEWIRLPANQKCPKCFPTPKPFLETALGKVPPEIREKIFKDVLTVGAISPLKYGISVPMIKAKQDLSDRGSVTKLITPLKDDILVPKTKVKQRSPALGSENEASIGPARPSSCLALLQTCRQIYLESSMLFYTLNTLYLSNPQDMLSFLRHLRPLRCNELGSLHLEDLLVSEPMFSQQRLNWIRSQGIFTEDMLALFDTERRDKIHTNANKAVKLLNKRGKIQKIYLEMRPSQTLEYIRLLVQIPGLQNSEIVFASPTRWAMVVQPPVWQKQRWFLTFVEAISKGSARDMPYYAYWGGNEKYRVQVDILRTSPEGRAGSTNHDRSENGGTRGNSSVHAAMEGLRFS